MIGMRPLAAALAATVVSSFPAAAQDLMPVCDDGFEIDHALGPTFTSAPTFKERFGGKLELDVCAAGANDLVFGRDGWHGLAFGGRYLLADADVTEPDASEIRATLLLGVGWFRVGDVDIDLEADPTEDESLVTSFGFTELGGTAAYQESVDREERQLTAGGVFRYGHERIGWIPSVSVRYELGRTVHSAARRAVGLDEKDAWTRFSVDVYENFRLRFVSETLEAFSLGGDLSYFRSTGLDPLLVSQDADWKSGTFVAGTVRWDGGTRLISWLELSAVYLRWAAGHRSTDATEQDGLRLGIDLTVDRGGE